MIRSRIYSFFFSSFYFLYFSFTKQIQAIRLEPRHALTIGDVLKKILSPLQLFPVEVLTLEEAYCAKLFAIGNLTCVNVKKYGDNTLLEFLRSSGKFANSLPCRSSFRKQSLRKNRFWKSFFFVCFKE